MIQYFIYSLFLILHLQPCYADTPLSRHLQLLVVTSDSWDDMHGTLQCFEKANEQDNWTSSLAPIPVVLGKSGMAWGIGLYPLTKSAHPSKTEGDLKSPAEIFSLGNAFGFLSESEMSHLKIDYLQLHEFIEAVDDPLSHSYNCIVDNREVVCDWNSSEKMRDIPLYEIGLVIHHNWPDPKPGKGSAIFFHVWRHHNAGTAGCTAMSYDDLNRVLSWLERDKNPVLIQLPFPEYSQLQSIWNLTALQ